MKYIKEFSYHISWRSRSRRPGRHKSNQRGMGMEFRGHTTLLSYPDPRRIDIRQTIRDPMEQVYVRIFNQKSATPVFVMCDLSGSMQYGTPHSKLTTAAEITRAVAQSATRNADPVGFIGFDDALKDDWVATLSSRPHTMFELADRLEDHLPSEVGTAALLSSASLLPRERSLIFLVSDFHMPLTQLEDALLLMLRHQIVPVILWNSAEYKTLPEFGITSINDPETGERRTLFLRAAYRQRILDTFEARRQAITDLFMKFDMQPFFVENTFDADLLTDYFHQYVVA